MLTETWLLWAVAAAAFAALMTIFAKFSLSGIDSVAAQLIRTAVVPGPFPRSYVNSDRFKPKLCHYEVMVKASTANFALAYRWNMRIVHSPAPPI